MPDPILKQAAAEILDILKKHDIAGMVSLQSTTHSEWLFHIEPSWSCIRLEHAEGVEFRVRITAKCKTGPESEKERIRVSTGMVLGFLDVARNNADQMTAIAAVIGQHMEVQHWSRFEPPA